MPNECTTPAREQFNQLIDEAHDVQASIHKRVDSLYKAEAVAYNAGLYDEAAQCRCEIQTLTSPRNSAL